MINKDGDPTAPYKLSTGTKPSVSQLRVLFCTCVVRKATAHVGTKALNKRHKAQKVFRGIFVGIPQHQKVYLVCVLSSRKIISPYDVVFNESLSSALAYTPKYYSEAMAMRQAVTYTPCATSSREKTGDIITFTQFEEGGNLTKTCNNAESTNDDSSMPPLLSEEDADAIDSGDDSDHDVISTEMLEDVRDGSQSHPNVNKRESCYKIRTRIRQRQSQWKGALKLRETWVKVYTRYLRLL